MDLDIKFIPINQLLCNSIHCYQHNRQKAKAIFLCFRCKCVGYCSIECMNADLYNHRCEIYKDNNKSQIVKLN